MKSKNRYIDNLKGLVSEYITAGNQNSYHRRKRGVLNFVREISKILFGTLTQSDAETYNSHITELEREQKEFLHLSKEQMTIIKTTITSVNSTIQKVNQNERILKEGLAKLSNYSTHRFNELEEEVKNVGLINEQFRLVQRGVDESQHSFEILIDAFVHAEQGTLQPQLITAEKNKNFLRAQRLPNELDYPHLPFPELQKVLTPSTYSYKHYLIYVLEIPLFSQTEYQLYRLLPFPVAVQNEEANYSYIGFNKELIFSDSLRQHYGKLSGCFHPNEFLYVCKEEIPIYTYIPEVDCEASLLHPSTTKIPSNCEYRFLKLDKTFWIALYLSNQWLFVTPQDETFMVLCPRETTTLKLLKKGKLTLGAGCKGYSSYITLYAMSTLTTNVTNDYVPSAPIDFDCCFENLKEEKLEHLPLHVPLMNILSSVDDLRIASVKADEMKQLIKEQELKNSLSLFVSVTSWGTVFGVICLFIVCLCCSFCCCKCCRDCLFWLWDKWTPRDCWRQTQDKCCVSIHNYNGSKVVYSKASASPSPVISTKSLPKLGSLVTEPPKNKASGELVLQEETEPIAVRTRNKKSFVKVFTRWAKTFGKKGGCNMYKRNKMLSIRIC
jgi:hypothetical protein